MKVLFATTNLAKVRKYKEELAEKVEIALTNMGKIERGESFVTASTLEKLAKSLDVKIHELFANNSFLG